jgi:cytochrome c2
MDNQKIVPYLINCLIAIIILFLAFAGVLAGHFIHQQRTTNEQRLESPRMVLIDNVSDLPPRESAGRTLFKNNCAACHNKDMKSNLTGPALGGTTERWAKYPRTDLYRWIRQSQTMISEKHPRALELWKEWQPTIMNDFPNLTDEDIEAILSYVESRM